MPPAWPPSAELPYKALAKAIDKGTRFVGLSDFTALQLALLTTTGATTWAGPALGEDFGTEAEPDEIMLACFGDLLDGSAEGSGWTLPLADAKAHAAKPKRHVHGATLWGGNLSVLCSLVGTPYLPAVKGGVLFLEDVGEHPYRLERQLTQLLLAGVLDAQKAVLLGAFNRFKPVPGYDRGFSLKTVTDWLRSKTKTPIYTGLPFGHVPTKVLLPVGRTVDVVVEGRDALIFWGHEHHRHH
jgi:muramoyltetrapeptide carboxypeptidase